MITHCGIRSAPLSAVQQLMPQLADVVATAPLDPQESYSVDVKVHMLMPGQYPCIPDWHVDCVPRGEDGKKDFSLVEPDKKMFLWLSGPPFTEFADGRPVPPETWVAFTQKDGHRGAAATEHCWRTFIRVAPVSLKPIKSPQSWLRQHSQVYLDASNFEW